MPVDKNGYGSSAYTRDKLDCFQKLLHMHVKICEHNVKDKGWKYLYIDMNAGPGWADAQGLLAGSPVVFMNETYDRFPCEAYFIEQNRTSFDTLRATIDDSFPRSANAGCAPTMCYGDHAAIAPRIIAMQCGTPLGMIYHDPNGEPSFDTLIAMSHLPQAYRLDFVVHFTATAVKRINGARRRLLSDVPNPLVESSVRTLIDHIEPIAKRHWIVREPVGPWNWTFLIGTNWGDFPAWQKAGFYGVNTQRGKEILWHLTYPKGERPTGTNQHTLPLT